MGYIVKAKAAPERDVGEQGSASCSDREAAALTEILVEARLAADRERAAATGQMLSLARKMAERIVGRVVDLDPTAMADIAGEALLASRGRGSAVVLRVHPDDLAAVAERRPRWLAGEEAPAEVAVVADESVGRYGCVVETPMGRVDARLQTQLDVLERVLEGVLPSEGQGDGRASKG